MCNNQPTEQQIQTHKLHHVSSLTGTTEGQETANFVNKASNSTTGNPIEAITRSNKKPTTAKMATEDDEKLMKKKGGRAGIPILLGRITRLIGRRAHRVSLVS